jgi:hypothetical protein
MLVFIASINKTYIMGKLYTTLFILAILGGNVYAIEDSEKMTTSVPVTGGFPHLSSESPVISTNYRLRAKTFTTYSSNAFVPVDSTIYVFSNGRGGYTSMKDPNNDESVYFDNSVTYLFDRSVGAYTNRLKRKQEYNENNKVTMLSYTAWKELAGIWRDSAKYVYSYDKNTSKLLTSSLEIWAGGSWSPHIISTLQYNSNNLTTLNSSTYNAVFSYDVNNNLVGVEDEQWSQSAGWQKNEKKLYVYSGDKVVTYTIQKWNLQNNDWQNAVSYDYAYNGGDKPAESVMKIWNGSIWVASEKSIYSYDKNGNKLEEIKQVWNTSTSSFNNTLHEVWEYNSNNLPVSITTSRWNESTSAWVNADQDYQIRFYYEIYWPTSVKSVASVESNMKCYPLPANDNLTIDVNLSSASKCSIVMMDVKGHIVRQWEESYTNHINKSVNVADLNTGNYFVKVIGNTETLTQQIAVIH